MALPQRQARQSRAVSSGDGDAELLQILICQIRENAEVDRVFSKALGVLGHAELFEPIGNLLHERSRAVYRQPAELKS